MREYWSNTCAGTACGNMWVQSSAGASTGTQITVPISQTTANATGWDYNEMATTFKRIYTFFEATNQQMFENFYVFGKALQQWHNIHELVHEPWNYIYAPGQDIEEMLAAQNEQLTDIQKKAFATQHLKPIDEALELEGHKKVVEHLEKLLNDEAYRNFQLTEINKINKILGLKECIFDGQKVQDRLHKIRFEFCTPIKVWAAKGWQHIRKEAEKRAEELFNEVFTPQEIMQLNTEKRLVIVRGDLAFELLPDAGINQLLPNGQKQGWCLVSKEYGLSLKDILVMKKLLLETAPEIVLQVANKRSPFS